MIEETYDTREEWDKDFWNIEKLGLYYAKSRNLNFLKINQPEIKTNLKKYLKLGLISKRIKPATAYSTLNAVNKFSEYLSQKHSTLCIRELTRSIFEGYLCWLQEKMPNPQTRLNYISRLNAFFTWCELHQYIEFNERIVGSKSKV